MKWYTFHGREKNFYVTTRFHQLKLNRSNCCWERNYFENRQESGEWPYSRFIGLPSVFPNTVQFSPWPQHNVPLNGIAVAVRKDPRTWRRIQNSADRRNGPRHRRPLARHVHRPPRKLNIHEKTGTRVLWPRLDVPHALSTPDCLIKRMGMGGGGSKTSWSVQHATGRAGNFKKKRPTESQSDVVQWNIRFVFLLPHAFGPDKKLIFFLTPSPPSVDGVRIGRERHGDAATASSTS